MYDKFKAFIKDLQDKGVVLLFVKDPVSKQPSVSLTLLIVSFTLCIVSLLTKFSGLVGGVDVDNTFELLLITAGLYFSRGLSKKVRSENKKEEQE